MFWNWIEVCIQDTGCVTVATKLFTLGDGQMGLVTLTEDLDSTASILMGSDDLF